MLCDLQVQDGAVGGCELRDSDAHELLGRATKGKRWIQVGFEGVTLLHVDISGHVPPLTGLVDSFMWPKHMVDRWRVSPLE